MEDLVGSPDQHAVERCASPSSEDAETSGYLGGSGSTEASVSSASGADEIREWDEGRRPSRLPSFNWTPGKRHADEDDTFTSWREHKKHFFILSNAGKPIYSRYGHEHKLAGFSATLQAIMSFVENSGDRIQYMRAGNHQIVFLVKGPLYLVTISATDEPHQALTRQLELLHHQLLLILTKAVDKCFVKNSKFDMRPLLGGTDVVFSSLIHSFNWNPTSFLHAYTCLPLSYTARQSAGAALQDAAESGVLFAILLSGHKVINIVGPRKASLHPDDLFLLSNFVSSSESFRTTESFSPVCLPKYNASSFLYAYVQYLEANVCLILISTKSDSFFYLKECRSKIEIILRKSRVLYEVNMALQQGGLHVEDLPADIGLNRTERGGYFSNVQHDSTSLGGRAGLWHFLYKSAYLNQYVSSEYAHAIHAYSAQKRLFRAYQRLHVLMRDGNGGSHKMQYHRDANHVLLYWKTADFELYAAFDPLADKGSAIMVCNQICQWLRTLESEIFLFGTTPFSW